MAKKTDRQRLEEKRRKAAAKATEERKSIDRALAAAQSAEVAKLEYDACVLSFDEKLEELEALGNALLDAKKLATKIRAGMKKSKERIGAPKIVGAHERKIELLEAEIKVLRDKSDNLDEERYVALESAKRRHEECVELRARIANPAPPAWIRNLVKEVVIEDVHGDAEGIQMDQKSLAKFFRRLHRWTKGAPDFEEKDLGGSDDAS